MLHLSPGAIPPLEFWSVTFEVEKVGQLLTPNPINRYKISSFTRNLAFNPDGSIDIWIQPTALSSDRMANWRPIPTGGRSFLLFARCDEPNAEVLNGVFNIPLAQARQ